MNENYLIELSNVTKVFLAGKMETHALENINLKVERGEYLCISGPSGCGKSTLLSIIGLLDQPTGGSHLFKGKPVENLASDELARIRNREIGFVFQNFNLLGNLSVWENVELPLAYRGMPGSERRRRVDEALARVNMDPRASFFPAQLSGGQQQRVAVARALAGNPSILLCDEPTGNLDSVNGEAVMQMLKQLHESGTTICMVTHDERFVHYARRIVHLFDGCIVSHGVAAE
jgi:putative ABC transport system ATP-binding protein